MEGELKGSGALKDDLVKTMNGAVEMARIIKKARYDERIRSHFASA